jgi:thiol-disulfide isomerase/thioredoxin
MKRTTQTLSTAITLALFLALNCGSAEGPVVGVGLALGQLQDGSGVKIMRILPGGPAAKAGLKPGLVVDEVDGVSLKGKSLNDCVALMRGAEGSKVVLHFVDPSKHETNSVALTRERINLAETQTRLGAPAAPLVIKDWVKGIPVDVLDGKAVYVVEFWATWCGPCRVSIPHLTELQKRWKDKGVTVVGVSDEPVATVKPFVEKMGDQMDYTVACDDEQLTNSGYMATYGLNMIPTAFIVGRDGRVLWHGHPMNGLDDALDQAVAGKLQPPSTPASK